MSNKLPHRPTLQYLVDASRTYDKMLAMSSTAACRTYMRTDSGAQYMRSVVGVGVEMFLWASKYSFLIKVNKNRMFCLRSIVVVVGVISGDWKQLNVIAAQFWPIFH